MRAWVDLTILLPMDDAEKGSLPKTGTEIVGAAAGAAAGAVVGGPIGAIGGAALGPAIAKGLDASIEAVIKRWQAQQHARVRDVIRLAAREADLEPETLVHRLEATDGGEDLFVRTMRAAVVASSRRKLILLSRALASGAADVSPRKAEWETVFVNSVAALDEVHLSLIERFLWSPNQLGLGNGDSEFDQPIMRMNRKQLEMVLPELVPVMDSLLGTLESEGLLSRQDPPGGMLGGGQSNPETRSWLISDFGVALVGRLKQVGEILRDW